MKAKIINQNYTATADIRTLNRLPYSTSKPWLARIGGRSDRFRTHAAAIRWVHKMARKGKA